MAWNWKRRTTVFQKTLAFNDYYFAGPHNEYPLGNVQLIGKVQRNMIRSGLPTWLSWTSNSVLDLISEHSLDWWVLGEDLPLRENRVELTRDGQVKVNVRWTNRRSHEELVKRLRSAMKRAGYPLCLSIIWNAEQIESCSHQVGTLCFGRDPKPSVLDE